MLFSKTSCVKQEIHLNVLWQIKSTMEFSDKYHRPKLYFVPIAVYACFALHNCFELNNCKIDQNLVKQQISKHIHDEK